MRRNQFCLVEPCNSIDNRRCRTPTVSGGAPLFIMCLCLQLRKDGPVHLCRGVLLADKNFLV